MLSRIRDDGAYSNVVLPHATKGLSQQDAGFVFSLVYGALRRLRLVDNIIEQATGRRLDQIDVEVRTVLEIAIAELLTDDHETAYATVNESVEAVKDLGKGRATSFVNGVLRNLLRSGMPDLETDAARDLSVPDWVLQDIIHDHGNAAGSEMLQALRIASPHIAIRVRPGAQPPPGATPVAGIASAFYLDEPVGTDAGYVYADAASTAVGLAVDPQHRERILDMAAAPGGKTLHLMDQAGAEQTVVAMDMHRRRLQSARRRLLREGSEPQWLAADATRVPFADSSFDAVLLDAPCTGLGTLRRRPEIAMRLQEGAPGRLAYYQRKMLAEAWRVTRPGGRIVYSVCTLFAAETVDVVEDYPARAPHGLPGRTWGKGGLLAPHLTGTDGMFIAVIDR